MRVYHLLSAEHGLSDIALHRIRISRFRDLNDPFELLAARDDAKAFRKGIRSWRDEFNEDNGLLCFSKDWKNPVLWSHYASKHRGMCLGFDVHDSLINAVTYTSDRLPLRFRESNPEKGLEEGFVRDLLRTKFKHWEYEDEVRVFLRLDHATVEAGSYFYRFDQTVALKEVILGPLCELPIREVRDLVHSAYDDVTVVKARLAYKWFALARDETSVTEEQAYWNEKAKRAKEPGATN